MAAIMVTGMVIYRLLDTCKIVPTVMAPKATCDSPSPINENLLRTSVTPTIAAQRAIETPTISAYRTKE